MYIIIAMKKHVLIIFILSAICLNVKGQDNRNDSISHNAIFKLFPTQNMWTFIKLDTRNGRMWQVQYNTSSEKRFETVLSGRYLVSEEKELINRFTIYPTQNIYNFLLLDQIDGRVWQVQWAFKYEDRMVIPIE